MSTVHCSEDQNAEEQGLGSGFSAEADAVLNPPAGTGSDRLGAPKKYLAQLLGALAEPVREPEEEGYPADYVLDEDGWGDAIETEAPAYLDPAEVLAVEAQRLANVRHALACGRGLTADDIGRLSEEEANLIADCSDLLSALLGGEE